MHGPVIALGTVVLPLQIACAVICVSHAVLNALTCTDYYFCKHLTERRCAVLLVTHTASVVRFAIRFSHLHIFRYIELIIDSSLIVVGNGK